MVNKNRGKIMIYFDNSATTVPYPEALRTYQEVATKILRNPSNYHQLGTSATCFGGFVNLSCGPHWADENFHYNLKRDLKATTGSLKELLLKSLTVNTLLFLILNTSGKDLPKMAFRALVSKCPMHQLMSKGLWMLKLLLDYYALTRSWFRLWLLMWIGSIQPIQAISDLLANGSLYLPCGCCSGYWKDSSIVY